MNRKRQRLAAHRTHATDTAAVQASHVCLRASALLPAACAMLVLALALGYAVLHQRIPAFAAQDLQGARPAEASDADSASQQPGEPQNTFANAQAGITTQAEASAKPRVAYKVRLNKKDWSDPAANGHATGIKTKRIQAVKIALRNANGSLAFRVHGIGGAWSKGWTKSSGIAEAGKKGMNAIKIKLTGKIAKNYKVAYRAHECGGNWQKWVTNGAKAGKASSKTRIDLIQVKLVRKGAKIVKSKSSVVRVGVAAMTSGSEGPTCTYIRKCGMVPVRVTSVTANISKLDGLVVPGGINDVTPSLYGAKQSPLTYKPRIERDKLFIGLIKKFAKAEKPIFGICGGEQHMTVALGGTLTQHIPGRHSGTRTVTISKNSFFYRLFGATEPTYHSHHQCAKKLGPGMVATQYDAKDGRIEGIEHQTLPIFGVQWHPENMGERGVQVGKLFKQECIAYRS